ncbi:extracellular solute-binding protein, partial [Thioclava sp. BHET1]
MSKLTDKSSSGVSRRDLLALGASTAGLVSLSTLGAFLGTRRAQAATDTLNFCSWGGSIQQIQIDVFQKPYTKKYGTNFNNIEKSGNGPALVTAQEQSGNVTWDVVDFEQGDANRLYQEGLLEEIVWEKDLAPGPDGKSAWEDFFPGALSGGDDKSGGFVALDAYNTMFSYNEKAFPNGGPQSVKDVFDVEKFPGKRGLQKSPACNLEWALYADGVAKDKIYEVLATPAGVDRAFKKLDTLKPHAVWWSEGAQPPQMLAQQDVVISSAWNGRIFNAIVTDNQPFEYIWDGGLYEWDGWVIPAGLPKDRLEEAKRFLRFSTQTKPLIEQTRY